MKEKKDGTLSAGAAEGGRRPTGAAPAGRERGRFSSGRKTEAVLRLLRGEALDALSRELVVAAATLAGVKEASRAAGRAGQKARGPDPRDGENARLKQLLGDREMRLEIHRQAAKLRGYELPFESGKRK